MLVVFGSTYSLLLGSGVTPTNNKLVGGEDVRKGFGRVLAL